MTAPVQPLLILTSAVVTAEGIFEYRHVTRGHVADLLKRAASGEGLVGYVGHEATASWFSRTFGIDVSVTRGSAIQEIDQYAVVVRLARRRARAGEAGTVQDADVELGVLHRLG